MYDKPLKTQWIEVNGRPVPLVLPQYWDEDEEDWVVSSTQNRLPVDAQLTGSTVVIDEGTNILVLSETNVRFAEMENVLNYKKIIFSIRWDSTPSSYSLRVAFRCSNSGIMGSYAEETDLSEFAYTIKSDVHGSLLFDARIANNSDNDHILRSYQLLGVK